ncbi:MAG: hypothetical protein ACAI44_15835 [Candidatus Sericytochromatia bacterium]
MTAHYSTEDAWAALERGDYSLATRIWLSFLGRAQDTPSYCRYQLGYTAVLIAQGQYREAVALLEEMHEITQDSLWLHQMGRAAREAGKLDTARAHFMAEQASLPHDAHMALALNAFELGSIALEEQKISVAFHYARHSLECAKKANDPIIEGYAYRLLGDVRKALKEIEKAMDCYEASREALNHAPARSNWDDFHQAALIQHPISA